MSNYGKRGGTSKNAGKRGLRYTGQLSDGTPFEKRTFQDYGPTCEAVALDEPSGRVFVMLIGPGCKPAWEGDYGRLTATKDTGK